MGATLGGRQRAGAKFGEPPRRCHELRRRVGGFEGGSSRLGRRGTSDLLVLGQEVLSDDVVAEGLTGKMENGQLQGTVA